MGIKNLLQFLKGSQRESNLSSFRGKTAAVDAYSWLHKGAYSCAMELVTNKEKIENLPFLRFCMKRVNMLLQHDITPIIVFDGAHLPMKSNTEKERRERRHGYLSKGKALLKEGKTSEARDCFQRCIDVSPKMALAFIKLLREKRIQAIVAPYEADAQLAYLVKEGLADFVITEDSDLLAFGASRVFFKMTDTGDGKLIELKDIAKGNKSLIGFTPDSFRHMCILSGCDYLPSIPGIGPSTAIKLMRQWNKDPYRVVAHLKRSGKDVPPNYEDDFRRADQTFLYQLVFDPRSQSQVRLNTPPSHLDAHQLDWAGTLNSPSKHVGLARGNINPLTFEKMDEYSPAKQDGGKGGASDDSRKPSQTWSGCVLGRSGPVPRQTTLIPVSKQAKQEFKKCRRASLEEDDTVSEDELRRLYGGELTTSNSVQSDNDTNDTKPEKISKNIFPKVTVRSKYFVSSDGSSSDSKTSSESVSALAQLSEQEPSSSVDSGLGNEAEGIETEDDTGTDYEDRENEDEGMDTDNEKGSSLLDLESSSSESHTRDEESNPQRSKRKLFLKEDTAAEATKRAKLENDDNERVTSSEIDDCIIMESSSTVTNKPKPSPFRLGLSKVSSSNKSSFKSPRPASGSSSSSSLLSFFTYKQKDKLKI